MYKLMSALRLPLAKQRGIVKAQIIQYASICEAVLDIAIEKYYKDEAEKQFEVTEYKNTSALSKTTKITVNGCEAFVCTQKKIKGSLKRTRMDYKTGFAAQKGLISGDVKAAFDNLYDLRNNIHILKAVGNSYTPKLREAKDAYLLMKKLVGEIKAFYASHQ